VLLDCDELSPGESCYAQLRLEEEVAVRRGDKFIVRFYSPMETIGGGEIIEPVPLKKKRFDDKLIEELKVKEKGSGTDVIEKLIRENSKKVPSISELAKITALSEDEIKNSVEILEEEEKVSTFRLKNDIYLWHKSFEREIEEGIEKYLFNFHENNKYQKGAKKSEIKSRFLPAIKQNVFDMAIMSFVQKGLLKMDGEFISLSYFSIQHDEAYEKTALAAYKILEDAKFEFLKQDELVQQLNLQKSEEIISLLIDEKKLLKIGELGITKMEIYERAKKILVDFITKNQKITAAEYRDLLNSNRKVAIGLLEHFDILNVTRRVGNDRVLF
jgi:selenocysteine-specific elongation factor